MKIKNFSFILTIALCITFIIPVQAQPGFTEIVPLQFDAVGDFSEGLAWVRLDDKIGFINTEGEIVIPLIYNIPAINMPGSFSFREGRAIVGAGEGWGRWAVIDREGNEIVPFGRYRLIGSFSEGLAHVQSRTGTGWGFIDRYGNEVIPLVHPDVRPFSYGRAAVSSGGDWPPTWGFMDRSGNIVISPRFDEIQFRPHQPHVGANGERHFSIGNIDLPRVGTDNIDRGFFEGMAAVRRGEMWGYIDIYGNEITPFIFYNADVFMDGAARVFTDRYTSGGGFINREGNRIDSEAYTLAFGFSEGAGRVDRGGWSVTVHPAGTRRFIDIHGNETRLPFTNAHGYFAEGLIAGLNFDDAGARHWGFSDKTGTEVISLGTRYNFVRNFYGGMAAVAIGDIWNSGRGEGKWGFIDTTGTEIVPVRFDEVRNFSEGRAAVRLGDKWGFIALLNQD